MPCRRANGQSDKLGFHSASVEIPPEAGPEDIDMGKTKSGAKGKAAGTDGKAGTQGGVATRPSWIVDVPMRSFQGGESLNLSLRKKPRSMLGSHATHEERDSSADSDPRLLPPPDLAVQAPRTTARPYLFRLLLLPSSPFRPGDFFS